MFSVPWEFSWIKYYKPHDDSFSLDLPSKESYGERLCISENPCVNHFGKVAARVNTIHAFLC